ncbi:MAG: hypothetical protein JWL67_416 [Solirubrobacterales bacterium]|nr:hypothetical protein [Solirubrobacterales bacterium]
MAVQRLAFADRLAPQDRRLAAVSCVQPLERDPPAAQRSALKRPAEPQLMGGVRHAVRSEPLLAQMAAGALVPGLPTRAPSQLRPVRSCRGQGTRRRARLCGAVPSERDPVECAAARDQQDRPSRPGGGFGPRGAQRQRRRRSNAHRQQQGDEHNEPARSYFRGPATAVEHGQAGAPEPTSQYLNPPNVGFLTRARGRPVKLSPRRMWSASRSEAGTVTEVPADT